MKQLFKCTAICLLALLTGCNEADTEAEISKCVLQGYSQTRLRTCMSAAGYDFKWESAACSKNYLITDIQAACYERRSIWRSAKTFF